MATNHNAPNDRKDGFKAPEGYFESFDQRLFERVKNTNQPAKTKRITLFKPRRLMAAAAAIAVLVGTGFLLKTQFTTNISPDALETYLEYNTPYTLSTEFIQAFDEKDIKELEQGIQINQTAINEYVQTNIDLDYYLNY